MTSKARKRLLLVIGSVIAVAALFLHYMQRDSYRCQVCFTKKDAFQWRLGEWGDWSVPLTPRWERITETRFAHDFIPADHVHDWMFAQGSPYRFFGTTWAGCAIGAGRRVSGLCQMYESSSEFRAFLQGRLRDGSLAKSNLIAMVSVPRTGESPSQKKDADELLEAFFSQRSTIMPTIQRSSVTNEMGFQR